MQREVDERFLFHRHTRWHNHVQEVLNTSAMLSSFIHRNARHTSQASAKAEDRG